MKALITHRVTFDWGYADAPLGPGQQVRIGDRLVPSRVDVLFTGADGQPSLTMRLEVVDGVPSCRELTLASVAGGREVRTLDLTAIRLAEWVDDVYAAFALRVTNESKGVVVAVKESDHDSELGAVEQFRKARKGKAARKIDDALLRQAAAIYTEHFRDRPIVKVAAAFGVSERTASLYITMARHAEHLPKTTRGKKMI